MIPDCEMPRQNRVTPYGALIAVPDRGMFWGNRGVLAAGYQPVIHPSALMPLRLAGLVRRLCARPGPGKRHRWSIVAVQATSMEHRCRLGGATVEPDEREQREERLAGRV